MLGIIIDEARWKELLNACQQGRAKLLDRCFSIAWLKVLETTAAFHSLSIGTTIILLIFAFLHSRRLSIIALHVVCAVVAVTFFFAEGTATYRNRLLLEIFSPIMQHSKKWKVRSIHQAMQIIGCIFVLLSLLFAIFHSLESQRYFPVTIHGLFGIALIVLIATQVVSGNEKLSVFRRNNTKVKRWHSDLGLIVWDSLCLESIFGFWEYFGVSWMQLIANVLVLSLWIAFHSQMRRKLPDFEQDTDVESVEDNEDEFREADE